MCYRVVLMGLTEVRIDETTWAAASEPRRREWLAAAAALADPSRAVLREEARALHVTVTEQALALSLRDASGRKLSVVTVPHDALADHITEYVDIVRQIAKDDASGGLTRLEALDMAKKVVHDRAAEKLRALCPEFGMDHPTARRLFTFLLSLRVDTTRLVGVHGHRRVK